MYSNDLICEMNNVTIELTELIDQSTDSISGRTYGEEYARSKKILELIQNGDHIVLKIDSTKIKAINDSFFKGFFSEIFRNYKTKDKVQSFFTVESSDYFKRMIEKNFTILDAIFNIK